MSQNLEIRRRDDGIATAIFDCPGKKVNTLSPALVNEVHEGLMLILEDTRVTGLVIGSAKTDSFIAGADLDVLEEMETADEAAELSRAGNHLLQVLAQSQKPVVAAIHGAALGGGLEVALACHYIIASNHPATVLALPEVQLGLLPAGGGTQRLVRRIGLVNALPLLLTGTRIRAQRALRLGIVDALTTPGGIIETAAQAALGLASGRLRRTPRKKSMIDRLAAFSPVRNAILRKARQTVDRKTRGNYPAPAAILDAVETGLRHGLGAGLARESEHFGSLVVSPVSRSLVGLFHLVNNSKKTDPGGRPRPVNAIGVVGAGLMGAGVASVSVADHVVVLCDIADDAVSRGLKVIEDGFVKQVRSGAITRVEADRRRSRLLATTDQADLGRSDVVVEAVFEDLELKRRVVAELEQRVTAETVIASNTSSLPITSIAAGARNPARVIGMHYFSPVPKMPLLEIVTTRETAPDTTATAVAVGRSQGKTCIVVRDGPGFYTTRILAPYLDEAVLLVEEGARTDEVDRVLMDFGFPIGPLKLIDEVGIDVAAHVAEVLQAAFADRGVEARSGLATLLQEGYQGRKNRRGFYLYNDVKRGPRPVNPEVYQHLGGGHRRPVPEREIRDRLSLMMVNEAARCLGEGIISCPSDGDLGAVLGLGFPPFLGGPFRWIAATGAGAINDRLKTLEQRYGARFAPASVLEDMSS